MCNCCPSTSTEAGGGDDGTVDEVTEREADEEAENEWVVDAGLFVAASCDCGGAGSADVDTMPNGSIVEWMNGQLEPNLQSAGFLW
jgi:hypothetical protein